MLIRIVMLQKLICINCKARLKKKQMYKRQENI